MHETNKPWVLFANGTCVILTQPETDLAAQAIALLKEWGPVQVGTPAADFSVQTLARPPGWVVTCHHPDILTYVSPSEFTGAQPAEVFIGLHGRLKRHRDAQTLEILHVETR